MKLAAILAEHGIGNAPERKREGAPTVRDATQDAPAVAQASRLRSLAADAGLNVSAVVRLADDLDALADCTDDEVSAYAFALHTRAVLMAGRVPQGWNTAARCAGCGAVWLWASAPAQVIACPWCPYRKAGASFPRPPVRCDDCSHFTRDPINPPAGVGRCNAARTPARNEPGLWPDALRRCAEHRL